MPAASGDVAKRVANNETGHFARSEDDEYERLVISDEDSSSLEVEPEIESCDGPWRWWIKAVTLSVITVVGSLFLMKWGVPYVFEKVNT